MSQLFQLYKSFLNRESVTAQPTFEDLIIDDNLPELDRVVRYVKSSIGLQRLVHVKMIASVANSSTFEEIEERLFPLFGTISGDGEPSIRRMFISQFPSIAKRCVEAGGERGYRAVIDKLLPIIAHLLEDEKAEIRQAASTSLVEIASIINAEDLGQYVLTIILSLAHDDANEEMRITASVLFNLLADVLGEDLCKQFVIPEVVSLAEDPGFRVRKSTALNFQHICKLGGEHELFERLMPAFVRLSKDDMYRVRRACADSLSLIAEFVSDDIRVGVLLEIFLRLAQDPSKLVKQSILQQSGMFIASLPGRVINSTILGIYCILPKAPLGDAAADDDLKKYCAYSFPGVLQAVGAARWGELRQVYHSLVQSNIPAVMHTLGLSLHVVARLLGEKIVEEELVPVFEEMIQDSDGVRLGVIKYLADFLLFLSIPCRVSYLPLLNDLLQSANPLNWRLRQSLASQLSRLMDLLPAQNLFGTLFPLTMSLLQDPVAEVRRASYDGVVRMVVVLHANLDDALCPPPPPGSIVESPKLLDTVPSENAVEISAASMTSGGKYLAAVARAINALVYSESFQVRQAWAELSLRLLRDVPQQLFEYFFVECVVLLSSDPVPNVRVSVSEMLTGWEPYDVAPWEERNQQEFLTKTLSRSHSGDFKPLSKMGSFSSNFAPHPPKRTDRPSPWKWLLAREDIAECVARMAVEDRDVYNNMQKLKPLFPQINFEIRSCRGLRMAPGGPSQIPVRPRTMSADDRLFAQPAVDIGTRRPSRASMESLPEEATNFEGVIDEGMMEAAPWVDHKSSADVDTVNESAIEHMFDISPNSAERSRMLGAIGVLAEEDDDEAFHAAPCLPAEAEAPHSESSISENCEDEAITSGEPQPRTMKVNSSSYEHSTNVKESDQSVSEPSVAVAVGTVVSLENGKPDEAPDTIAKVANTSDDDSSY